MLIKDAMMKQKLILALLTAISISVAQAHQAPVDKAVGDNAGKNNSQNVNAAKVVPLQLQSITGLDATTLIGQMLTVEYLPGGQSASHRHPAHTFVYVLEGSVEMQVAGKPSVVLHAGDTFYETPEDIHTVSRNVSHTQPAKFLVFAVKERDTPLVVPVD